MIQQLKAEYPVRQVCTALECPLSTAYYQPRPADEEALIAAIEQVLLRFPTFGYRKVYQMLRRQGLSVGEHVVRRLLREMNAGRSVGKVRVQTTQSNHDHLRYPNQIRRLRIRYPDQVWVADITYIRLGRRFIFLAVILDACTRAVRGWALSRTLEQSLTLAALEMALTHGTPAIFHSDQGSQYAARQHTQRLQALGVTISMSDKGSPTQNGIVERFMRTVKEEHVDYSEYEDFDDAYRQLKHWLEVTYMTERPHQALAYWTPLEFEQVLRSPERQPLLIPA